MKIAVYSCREDERDFFLKYGEKYGAELSISPYSPKLSNSDIVAGCQAVSVITTPVDRELIRRWHEMGVKVISTRTIGYEHIDVKEAEKLGITVSNVSYSADTVAEYTVMCMLMAVRKMKAIMTRYLGQDYSLKDVRGREISKMTVGVIGTGRIGETVIRDLSGFCCNILAYDLKQKESVKRYASYVDLGEIWKSCDIITLHMPASEETNHLIGKEALDKMKDGVILINTARGSLIDTSALIAALESGKVGAAALDVVEGEGGIYYKDFKYRPVGHREMAVLQSMPNVLMTPHTAFFTDEAVSDMIEFSISSCVKTLNGDENPWQVTNS